MAFKLEWDKSGERFYETGVDRGVLYPTEVTDQTGDNAGHAYNGGVEWNGLTSVTESPSGAEANDIYADNMLYASLRSAEKFGGTIEAYMYPEAFAACNGEKSVSGVRGVYAGQQKRSRFGFSYRSDVGNDQDGDVDTENGYKIHMWYNCTASPSERQFQTINDSPEAITMSWEISTTPIKMSMTGFRPTALVVVDTSKLILDSTAQDNDIAKLAALENALYGTSGSGGADAYLPTPDQVYTIMGYTPPTP